MENTTNSTRDLVTAALSSVGMFFVNLIGAAFLGGAYRGVNNIPSAFAIFLPFIILNLICVLVSLIFGNKDYAWGFILGYITALIYFTFFFILPLLF